MLLILENAIMWDNLIGKLLFIATNIKLNKINMVTMLLWIQITDKIINGINFWIVVKINKIFIGKDLIIIIYQLWNGADPTFTIIDKTIKKWIIKLDI